MMALASNSPTGRSLDPSRRLPRTFLVYLRLKLFFISFRSFVNILHYIKRYILGTLPRPERFNINRRLVNAVRDGKKKLGKGDRYLPAAILDIDSQWYEGRKIAVRVYASSSDHGGAGIHLNWHGSGFCMPSLDEEADLCTFLAQKTSRIILDCDYSKSPEYPYPHAVRDAQSVLAFVLSKEGQKVISRRTNREIDIEGKGITLSGFSAGANLALGLCYGCHSQTYWSNSNASAPNPPLVPSNLIRGITLFYPSIDATLQFRPNWIANRAFPKGTVGRPIAGLLDKFFTAYLGQVSREDTFDPILSPLQGEGMPAEKVLIVTCQYDPLRDEGVAMVEKLRKDAEELNKKREGEEQAKVLHYHVEGVGHAWDKEALDGTVAFEKVEKTYQMAAELIREVS